MRSFPAHPILAGLVAVGACLGAAAPAQAKPTTAIVATYDRPGQISAKGSVLALALIDQGGRAATLFVGDGTAAPVAANGAGPLPRWAIPHVGTDATGATIVTYPRCATTVVSSCDLYAWDVARAQERKLDGVNSAKTGETEGVFDRGSLAFNRWIGTDTPRALVDGTQAFERTSLYYRPAGGKARRLQATGGRQLALRGDWIAQVSDVTRPDSGGICGVSAVQLVRTNGRFVRQVRETTCGENGSLSTGPAFAGNSLVFGSSMNLDDGILFRHDLRTRRTFQGRGPGGFVGLAFTKTNAAYVMRHRDGDEERWTLERFTGLAPSSTKSV